MKMKLQASSLASWHWVINVASWKHVILCQKLTHWHTAYVFKRPKCSKTQFVQLVSAELCLKSIICTLYSLITTCYNVVACHTGHYGAGQIQW